MKDDRLCYSSDSLSDLGIAELKSEVLGRLVSLEDLNISENNVSKIPPDLCLPKLRKLNCSDNMLKSAQFVEQFPALEVLNLEGNDIEVSTGELKPAGGSTISEDNLECQPCLLSCPLHVNRSKSIILLYHLLQKSDCYIAALVQPKLKLVNKFSAESLSREITRTKEEYEAQASWLILL